MITWLRERKDGSWVKVTLTRSHTRLWPRWREQGSAKWTHDGQQKFLVRRWHGEAGKLRVLVQLRPTMTPAERSAWVSPDHLENTRRFQ